MKQFLLTPFLALFDRTFYRDVLQNWRAGKAALFLFYLGFLYAIGITISMFGAMAKLPQYFGELDDQHVAFQMLSVAPHEWRVGDEGLSLFSEDGEPVEQWNYEQLVYVDTTQGGDFMPPGDYAVIVSKSLLWSPHDSQGRTFRVREILQRQKMEQASFFIYRDRDGYFDHIEVLGSGGESAIVTKVDLQSSYGWLKFFFFTFLFFFMWFFMTVYKVFATLFLSLIGLMINALSKSGLGFGQIFILSLLVQSWVLVVNFLESVFPFLAPIGRFLSLLVSVAFLCVIFYKFLPSPSAESSGPGAPPQ